MSDENRPADPPPTPPPAVDEAIFKAALKRHNDDAYALSREAWQQAERHRCEAEDVKARLPADGSTVLSADDATAYAQYRELGDLSALAAKLAERDQFAAQLAAHERRRQVEAAAASFGFDPDVLESLPGAADLTFDFVEEFRNGRKAKFAHVQVEGEKPKPLDKYAAEAWPKFLPALKAVPTPAPPRTPAVPVPASPAGAPADLPRRRWSL